MDRNKIKILLIAIALLLIGIVVGTLYSVTRKIKTTQPITKNSVENNQNKIDERPGQNLPAPDSAGMTKIEAKSQELLKTLPAPAPEGIADVEAKSQELLKTLPAPAPEGIGDIEAKSQELLKTLPAPQ